MYLTDMAKANAETPFVMWRKEGLVASNAECSMGVTANTSLPQAINYHILQVATVFHHAFHPIWFNYI
jgi:hypothetical protein